MGYNHSKSIWQYVLTHSRMEHYFFSYLLACEIDLFENCAILAIKSDIVTFFHVKSIKVTSGLNLRRKKKWRCHAEKSKTNLKTLVTPLWMRPKGSQGYQKMRQDPLNMPHKVWRANIALKLKNIQKCQRKQGFLMIFFHF